jgi:hypothetical protein
MIKGLNPAAGTGRDKMPKDSIYLFHGKNIFDAIEARLLASTVSTVVEHLTLNPLIKGLNPAAGTGREKMPIRVIFSFIKNFF